MESKNSKKESKNNLKESSKEKEKLNKSLSESENEENEKEEGNIKINKITLENFKSFEGRHEIGFFKNFTVVLGPNGSGKSNIIDALSFAFGLNTNYLRIKNLKDLITKCNLSQKKTCSVEICLIENNKNEIIFKRNINYQGTCQYYFNGNKINSDDYFDELEKKNIPSKTMYFILAQGTIDSFFSKKNNICEIIEKLSGSNKLKVEYDNLSKKISDLDIKINKLSNEINILKDDKNKVKNIIENKEAFDCSVNKINKMIKKIYLLKLIEQDNLKDIYEEKLKENKIEIEKIENEKIEIINLIKEGEINIKKNENEENKISEENLKMKNNYKLKKDKISTIEIKIKESESKILNKISIINQMKSDLKKKSEKKKLLLKEKENVENNIKIIKGILDNDSSFIKSNISKEQIEEYKKISLSLQSNTISSIKKKENLNNSLNELETKKKLIEKTIYQIENEKTKINEENKILSNNIFEMNENIKKIEEDLKKLKEKYSNLSEKKEKIENDYNSCYINLQEKIFELSKNENNTFENNKRKKISELMNQNEKVYGFLYELIIPLQKKLELPIKVSLIKYLNFLVVENSETAFKVSEFLKKKDLNCELLVLSNIPKKEFNESIRLKIGNMGNLIIDLIDCRKENLKKALNFFLNDTILCHNVKYIKELRNKNFKKIILLDGTVYKKNVISGGNYKNLNQFVFNYSNSKDNYIDTSKNLKQEIDILTNRLKEILIEKEKLENEISLKGKMIELENDLEMNKKNLESKKSLLDKNINLLNEKENIFLNCENSIKELNDKIDNINNEKEKINSELNGVKEQFFSDFMNKNKLKDLKEFEPFSINEVKRLSNELKEKEEKLFILENKIKSINNFEENIINYDTELEIEKKNKNDLEKEKENLKKEYEILYKEYEKCNKENGIKINDINKLKDNLSQKYDEIGKKDKRIRALLKEKIEIQHNISSSLIIKKQIISEAKTNNHKLLKELGESYEKNFLIIQIKFNIDDIILKTEIENEYNIDNYYIDYKDIEKENENLNIERINEKINQKKEKLKTYIEEIHHYLKSLSLNEKNEKLKEQENILKKNKKTMKTEIDELIKKQESEKEKYIKVKNLRKKKFEKYFNKLQKLLYLTYKNLTKSEYSPGGNAYIYNTNKEEPYNGEIIFLPTPPGKKVIYDIDQLSGGEKTISLISLLVSFQKLSKTPFLILDEFDAFLDLSHEVLIEKLFNDITSIFQVVIVTHKYNIFKSAHSLIGTYFNKCKKSSVSISLNMNDVY